MCYTYIFLESQILDPKFLPINPNLAERGGGQKLCQKCNGFPFLFFNQKENKCYKPPRKVNVKQNVGLFKSSCGQERPLYNICIILK